VRAAHRPETLADPKPPPRNPRGPGSTTLRAFVPGTRFGDLELVREIGRGGQAVVFEARQLSLDRTVAVKLLSRDLVAGDEQAARFRREAEATGRMQHPNIVAVYEYREVEDHPLIVEEYVPGKSLSAALEERQAQQPRLDAAGSRWVADICRQLALALGHAHRHGVVHRDIKPDNVLLTPDGIPKIADFGLAKVEGKDGLSMSGAILGTPYYMSPEQIGAAVNPVDERSDVYGLGATLYRMLTHRVPVRSKNLEGIFLDILHRPPTPPRSIDRGVPRDLEAVCLKALEKNPRARYQGAQEFADDLQRFLDGQPTSARPVGPLLRMGRAVARLAPSTLATLVLLVPALFLLVDRFALAPLGPTQAAVFGARLGLSALAAALLGWSLAQLAVRWSGGRKGLIAPALLLALCLGGLAGWQAHDERMRALHGVAREAFALEVELSTRRDVEDLRDYAEAWGPRLGEADFELLARGYLARGRLAEARPWWERGLAVSASPVFPAMAALAESAPTEPAAGDAALPWRDWKRIGDVLRAVHRPAEAHAAYTRAAGQADVDRDAINLDLGWTLADLCDWEAAGRRVAEVLDWRPDDPRANHLALRIDFARNDYARAEQHLQTFEASPAAPLLVRLERRYEFLQEQLRFDEAAAFLERAALEQADRPEVLAWCAGEAYLAARQHEVLLQSALAQGNVSEAQAHMAELLAALRRCEGLYQQIGRLRPAEPDADIGLSGVALQFARFEPAAASAHLDAAVAAAEAALAKAPEFWEAHANRAQAVLRRALTQAGSMDALPDEVLSEYVDGMQRALSFNALDPSTLNDTAYVLGLLGQRRHDSALAADALELARRASRLCQPEAGSRCTPPPERRLLASEIEDTTAGLFERSGDLPSALEAARRALALLDASDGVRAQRAANVDRLAGLVAADR